MRVVACVDSSNYAASVCDHAAWLSGSLHADLDVIHVEENDVSPHSAPAVLRQASERLADQGVAARSLKIERGEVAPTLAAAGPDILLIGKRGKRSEGGRRTLGSNTAALIRGGVGPLCIVSQVYLPISRALVLLDGDSSHQRTVDTIARNAALSSLDLDILVFAGSGEPEGKLKWARETLGHTGADIFSVSDGTPDAAAASYGGTPR